MAQWINLNRNNRSVLASRYSVLKNWPYPPTASGSYGRIPANKIRVDFEILKLLYRLNYSEFYIVQ